uniref:SCP domain-containing protein n=1 Tax=Mesocestoides corti TaxID=53468 RepID=A0A5K3FVD7_MESCO
MNLLTYSEELEKLADNWASRCRYDYPDTEPGYENTGMYKIVSVDRKPSYEEMGRFALEASSKYNFHTNDDWNYRLFIRAISTGVGCAQAKCHNLETSKDVYYMNCVFNNADQVRGGMPYEYGAICSMCPANFKCHRNQCTKMLPPAPQDQLIPTTTSASTTTNAVATLQAAMLSISYFL